MLPLGARGRVLECTLLSAVQGAAGTPLTFPVPHLLHGPSAACTAVVCRIIGRRARGLVAPGPGAHGGRKSVLPRDHARAELFSSACLPMPTWLAGGALVPLRRVASSLPRLCGALPVGDELATAEEGGGTPHPDNSVDSNALADIAGRILGDGRFVDAVCACWPGRVFLR